VPEGLGVCAILTGATVKTYWRWYNLQNWKVVYLGG
jgi:hypothetical protein